MQWWNTATSYGWLAIAMHWLVALAVVGMFALGLWMTGLGYYHDWYHRAPALHRAVGIVLFALVLLRLGWRLVNPPPPLQTTISVRQRALARWGHRLLYALLLLVPVAGYLIGTAKGDPVDVFGWFEVPALVHGLPGQEDIAGEVHEYLAFALIGLAAVHALAGLKHEFIDSCRTLRRMLWPGGDNEH